MFLLQRYNKICEVFLALPSNGSFRVRSHMCRNDTQLTNNCRRSSCFLKIRRMELLRFCILLLYYSYYYRFRRYGKLYIIITYRLCIELRYILLTKFIYTVRNGLFFIVEYYILGLQYIVLIVSSTTNI